MKRLTFGSRARICCSSGTKSTWTRTVSAPEWSMQYAICSGDSRMLVFISVAPSIGTAK
jgi:hypothetical protein